LAVVYCYIYWLLSVVYWLLAIGYWLTKERTKPKRQNNGERDAKVLVGHGGGGRGPALLLASTTKSAHTGAGATPRNWLPAGTDGPSTAEQQGTRNHGPTPVILILNR
jgi:hypothetical protein